MKSSHLRILFLLQMVSLVLCQEVEESIICHNGYAVCAKEDPNHRAEATLEIQAKMMKPGRGVQRGPNWNYGDEDGGPGSSGDVMDRDTGNEYLHWVHWPNGNERIYAMQTEGTYDIMFSQEELEAIVDDCFELDGSSCKNGESCGNFNSRQCSTRTCGEGYFKQCTCSDESGNPKSKCCTLDTQLYPNGRYNDFCAPLQCTSTPDREEGFWFWQGVINENCQKCTSFMDPHVVTFDEAQQGKHYYSYGYQGCGEYSMAQEGVSYSPEYGIFARFDEYCGYGVSCVSSAKMVQDSINIMVESPKNEQEVTVTVNGVEYDVPISPEFVPVEGNDKVLAWNLDFENDYIWSSSDSTCVFFQGTKGLLIEFCGNAWANTLYTWATPDLIGQINGMCGSLTGETSDDYTTRQGSVLPHSSDSLENWAESWLTDPSASTNCPSFEKKTSIEIKENCMSFDIYEEQCKATISSAGSNLDPAVIEDLIGACTFDLCNVDDPEGYLEGAVAETVKIQDDTEKVTVNITSPEGCSRGMESIGAECFKRIEVLTTDWEEAKALCQQEGMYLAEPWDIQTVATFLRENYDIPFYWVGGRGDGEVPRWLSGGVVSNAEPWMQDNYEVAGGYERCLDLVTYGNWPLRGETLAAGYCSGEQHRASLCSPIRRSAQ